MILLSYCLIKVNKQFLLVIKKELDSNNNTILEAYHKFIVMFPKFKSTPVHINLIKNITIGSGLCYSASNAVAMIKLICHFFNIFLAIPDYLFLKIN